MFAQAVLAVLLAHTAQARDRVFKASDLPDFRLVSWGSYKYEDSKTPGNVVRWFTMQFRNALAEEIDSVDLRFRTTEDGKTTFEKPFTISRFYDYGFSNWGGALPHRMAYTEGISFDYDSNLWNANSSEEFEIVAIHLRPHEDDLHDVSHLYTWLARTSPTSIYRRLTEDPSILKATNSSGATAMMAAFQGTTVPVIRWMIGQGAKLNLVERVNKADIPMMLAAALNADTGPMEFLKGQGQSVDAATSGVKQTALQIALQSDHVANAVWLLRNGAKPNLTDSQGNPPSFYAMAATSPTVMDLLKQYGADLKYHSPTGYGLLHQAAGRAYRRLDMVQHLVGLGLAVDDTDPRFGVTPLMVAAKSQSNQIARWLILHGARLDARDKNGKGVLDYAEESNTLKTDRFFRQRVLDELPRDVLRKAGLAKLGKA